MISTMTEYFILKETGVGAYEAVHSAQGHSPEQALRTLSLDDGTYLVVPMRSYNVLTVTTETSTKVRVRR